MQRGLILLEACGQAGRGLSLAELQEVLRIDRSSVFRLVNTLVQRGFLSQSDDRKSYALGPAIWRLAGQMRHSNSLGQAARQYVAALAAKTGETTHLAVRENDQVVFVDDEPTSQIVGVASRSGRCEPIHCTALGKALIGDFDRAGLVELFGAGRLPKFTDKTIRTIGELERDCQRIRKTGIAVDDEEFRKGVRCIAAPIRDCHGTIVAAIGISAPSGRLPKSVWGKVGREVRAAAESLSVALGYPGRPESGDVEEGGNQ